MTHDRGRWRVRARYHIVGWLARGNAIAIRIAIETHMKTRLGRLYQSQSSKLSVHGQSV